MLDGPPAEGAGAPARPAAEAEVRVATPADAESLGRLLYDFNTEYNCPTPSAAEAAGRFERLLAREDVLAVVARVPDRSPAHSPDPDPDHRAGTDVGFALLTLRPTPYWDGPLAQLEELYIRNALRSRGIGTAIMGLATSEVERRGGREIHINVDSDDTDARRFYERHGYSDTDPDSGSGMRCYLRRL
ncbi:GNAT family N-acetyltransferase [Rhodococcus sp. IEGM 1408]|uniref:GNAT family N-acetyltransferase n=1 Tax=Rhodococcus sp. IEGM 1408 TaxID=3082220 RepID=UPI002952AB7A|nr:GNAT family N-acetyltransferase [Rhodococcus sp. IEGM 1408]MDV8002738.1 GNAT family N-acetyltransferase [Rhodococcus sp. IEGM 1408]